MLVDLSEVISYCPQDSHVIYYAIYEEDEEFNIKKTEEFDVEIC